MSNYLNDKLESVRFNHVAFSLSDNNILTKSDLVTEDDGYKSYQEVKSYELSDREIAVISDLISDLQYGDDSIVLRVERYIERMLEE